MIHLKFWLLFFGISGFLIPQIFFPIVGLLGLMIPAAIYGWYANRIFKYLTGIDYITYLKEGN